MAEDAKVSDDPEFQQGLEPGASRDSMLVATELYDDLIQYIEPEPERSNTHRKAATTSATDDPEDDDDDIAVPESTATGANQSGSDSWSDHTKCTIDAGGLSPNPSPEDRGEGLHVSITADDSSDSDDIRSQGEAIPSPGIVVPGETSPELEYVHSTQWRNHDKHIFILSRAGKPIYCRHGDEDRLVTLFGVMQALVSFISSSKDSVRYITAGDHKIVFLVREHLILVGIAQTGECTTHLLLQLTYVYNQVLSILTVSQLHRIFTKMHNYDLRRLLSGTEKTFDSLLNVMKHDPSFFLGAVRCLPLEASVRDSIAQIVAHNAKVKDLVFAIVITNHQLITLVRMKRYFLHPLDLHLIFNLVSASESFKTAESWIPICLPKFDANGYLHAYVSYLDESFHSCLLLLTVDKDLFFTLADCKKKIVEKLNKLQYFKSVSDSIRHGNFSISQAGIPELRHFLYKSRSTAQYTSPKFEAPYSTEEEKERIFRMYQHLHYRIHSNGRPLKIIYTVGEYETLLGWVTSGFELYTVFGQLVTKPLAINCINKLLKWIKKEEDKLFILNSPTF